MERLWIGLSLLAVFIIGLIEILTLFKKYFVKAEFLREYRNNFVDFVNKFSQGGYAGKTIDQELYNWLALNASKAQRIAGTIAKGHYTAPFRAYTVSNYEFIINTIPKFRAEAHLHETEITFIDDILMMAIGEYQEDVDHYRKEIKNPFKWFKYGIRFIMKLPIQILSWFGVISERTFIKITASSIFKFFAGVAALIGFVSAIVGLITGWDAFIATIDVWIKKYFP